MGHYTCTKIVVEVLRKMLSMIKSRMNDTRPRGGMECVINYYLVTLQRGMDISIIIETWNDLIIEPSLRFLRDLFLNFHQHKLKKLKVLYRIFVL